MDHNRQFYIGGEWVKPSSDALLEVVNPATEETIAAIAAGSSADIDRAVAAAREGFKAYSQTTVVDRIALLRRILEGFEARLEDLSQAMSLEMGVPIAAARTIHYPSGPAHLIETIKVMEDFSFASLRGSTLISKEPIGVCGLITPWNFPINQVVCKIAPALAAGCSIVLKPSEISPLSALIIAEILDDAGTPKGVFNLVNGTGIDVGRPLAAHSDVDMISFTGSTRAGIDIAKAAADTVKRVAQELGGKSANILLPDVDMERAVTLGVQRCFNNSGQSCVSPTRLLVPRDRRHEVAGIARSVADKFKVGDPADPATTLGPVASRSQFEKVQRFIQSGISEGATLVAGGPERPDGLTRGFFVRPTVFGDVSPNMAIAREEIFGPVLSIIPYDSEDHAVDIANATAYGLAAFVQSADLGNARKIATRLRVGMVHLNYPPVDRGAPFGGVKQSGNGREWGEYGVNEFLETKATVGHSPKAA